MEEKNYWLVIAAIVCIAVLLGLWYYFNPLIPDDPINNTTEDVFPITSLAESIEYVEMEMGIGCGLPEGMTELLYTHNEVDYVLVEDDFD